MCLGARWESQSRQAALLNPPGIFRKARHCRGEAVRSLQAEAFLYGRRFGQLAEVETKSARHHHPPHHQEPLVGRRTTTWHFVQVLLHMESNTLHACYLLRSLARSKPPHATYIGYTTDVARRIRQHNGLIQGGAKKTTRHRPWEVVGFVHGFADSTTALRFEWAWQNPTRSRAVRSHVGHLGLKPRTSSAAKRLQVLAVMVDLPEWREHTLAIHLIEGAWPLPPALAALQPLPASHDEAEYARLRAALAGFSGRLTRGSPAACGLVVATRAARGRRPAGAPASRVANVATAHDDESWLEVGLDEWLAEANDDDAALPLDASARLSEVFRCPDELDSEDSEEGYDSEGSCSSADDHRCWADGGVLQTMHVASTPSAAGARVGETVGEPVCLFSDEDPEVPEVIDISSDCDERDTAPCAIRRPGKGPVEGTCALADIGNVDVERLSQAVVNASVDLCEP